MTPDTFETRSLRSRNQFEAWREWHQPVLDFLPQQSIRFGFPAEVHSWKLGGLAMSRTSVPPVSVARTKSNLRRDPATACRARTLRTRLGPRSKYCRMHFRSSL